ncbi:permease prefix domain 1-containing protein [Catellatospora sp. KI3]|uniref:permease prefix domain 1-containing protein n=1 Tax=Catellatospora sp. KI3 TaxID=3041620 RepID=UPI0024827B5B|nr:permease prefix domain 1-containing protein [Catellatospora sp. KI3]MDI1462894.1 permease prefix domain 1-containing protein [Catellatospora sp. KI3]
MTDSSLAIHRLLDEAFAGIDMTAEARDLKEEMRANLVARVAELEQSGVGGDESARRAMAELGDVRSIVAETAGAPSAAPWLDQRVRPRPAFVLRTLLLSLLATAALAILVLTVLHTMGIIWEILAVAVLAATGGLITADALRQETTTNYPLPTGRALGYGAAAALGLAGAGIVATAYPEWPVGPLVAAGVLLVVAAVAFTWLGVTQTNRHKPWVVRMQREHHELGDPFAGDPAAAARFGIYTAAIWIAALGGFVLLTLTAGWAWSWLALLGGLLAMLVLMARTLFRPRG